ncbi:CASP-like protein 4B1 [Cucumis melo var. makuwa]|uniref:CASP-like protein n=1 Tax=Cucumis melo var. makuwa TaxID=1194695 RepID=A0A5A7TQT0_CUCMM|nr:CASP-like protein 4B1 [Cucumis melo var. makuwa]
MSNPEDSAPTQQDVSLPPAPPAADLKSQSSAASSFGVSEIVSRWRREDILKRRALALRGFAFIFSLLAFIIMASNKHGDWKDFDKYEEFRYVLAIEILSTLYTGAQVLRQFHELSTGKSVFLPQKSVFIDFIGDQSAAYLQMSAASSAVPMTNRMREGSDSFFTDSLAASVTMSFFAFLSLALSSIISGYKLSTHSYI